MVFVVFSTWFHLVRNHWTSRAGLFKVGLREPRVSAKFELRYEILNSFCFQFGDSIL